LARWVRERLGLKLPGRAVCPGHQSPLDYLWLAYREPAPDLVVWAPRGGGKTRLGAVATLLDLLHKAPCQARILGGSLDQSLRMWEYLLDDVTRVADDLIEGRASSRRLRLSNGSDAAVLTQSQRAVRGLHVQKLRCDEVELFDPQVWEASQLVPRSGRADEGGRRVQGSIEAMSTLHAPGGLMQRIVDSAQEAGLPVVRWCLLEVLEPCPEDRQCAQCPLDNDCGGRAHGAGEGFVLIDDAIAMKRRVSRKMWEAEMLCRGPTVRHGVFPDFDRSIHVRQGPPAWAGERTELTWGIDFGYHAPFVCLWIESFAHGVTFVLDEYVESRKRLETHLQAIESRPHGRVRHVACDPAGAAPNEQTAKSNVDLLHERRYEVHRKKSGIADGLEMIRAGLAPAAGEPTLYIHPRCKRLIAAMQGYRFGERGGEVPFKDGEHDHPIDALRYFYVNRPSGKGGQRPY
jgi:hypothetical protein